MSDNKKISVRPPGKFTIYLTGFIVMLFIVKAGHPWEDILSWPEAIVLGAFSGCWIIISEYIADRLKREN